MNLQGKIPCWLILIAVLALFAAGCTRGEFDGDDPVDTYENPGGEGPEILFLPDHEPALMPFPSDIATKPDDSTVTGVRINVGKEGKTDLNKKLRNRLRKLDGFGTTQPITATFSYAIDLDTVTQDSVYVINVQPDSPRYGEIHPVDFENEFYPINLEKPESFFPNDSQADCENIQFQKNNRKKFYEDETDTLILRTLTPLQQSARYAVVLTRFLTDRDGFPIRPPEHFEYITFPTMLDPTERAVKLLNAKVGLNVEDVAFVWSFTTQTISDPLETLRNGLYGRGPFAYLADEFLPRITEIHQFGVETDGQDDPYLLGSGFFEKLFKVVIPLIPEADGLPLDEMINMENVEYIISGTYTTADFLDTEDRYFEWDWRTGQAQYGEEEVPFFISIPKPTAANGFAQPPYPVVIFQHANIRSRLDSIALANAMARKGMATFAIDAAEHGPETYLWAIYGVVKGLMPPPPGLGEGAVNLIVKLLLKLLYPSLDLAGKSSEELVDMLFAEDTFFGSALHGRSIDADGDGVIESGNTYYSADIFRTKAISMQTVFDLFLLVKVIHNLGTDWDGDGRLSREEGDLNLDGVSDLGGANLPIYFVGMSLGSILGSSFVALEPTIETAVLNVPGGILTDILQRTQIPNVNAAIRMDLMGPIVVGRPTPQGDTALTFNMDPMNFYFARIPIHGGARVVLTNLDSDETRWKRIADDGNFAISLAADKGDWMLLQVVDDDGNILEELTWAQEFRGLGVERNTPVARSFIETAQWAVDAIDPINFAPFFRLYPRPGNQPKNVLLQICMPDTAVPSSAGIALARAAGFIDQDRQLRLKNLGIFDFGYSTYVEANLPIQSKRIFGWRIHPGYNHEYLLAPRDEPNSVMYSFAAKEQAALFIMTEGERIEDNLHVLVPPEYYVPGF